VHCHHRRLSDREAIVLAGEVGATRDHRCVTERRIHLVGACLEHQQRQAGKPAAEQSIVSCCEAVGDEWIGEAGKRTHSAVSLADDRGVVHGDPWPVGDPFPELLPCIAQGESHQAGVRCGTSEGEMGGELLDLVDRHLVGHVDRLGEPRCQFHRGMDCQRLADVVAEA
jgi:hypothetical protein